MATNEEIDDPEQLRLLALQSMVRRSMHNNSNKNTDDQDILLLRAAALKTITPKNSTQNSSSMFNKNSKFKEAQLANEIKKSKRDQVSPSRKRVKNKNKNSLDCDINNSKTERPTKYLKTDSNPQCELEPKLLSNVELQCKPETIIKDNVKKVVRNGSILLSNLNSDGIDETMVLHITFSSSESDDSSNESDTNEKQEKEKAVCDRIDNNEIKLPAAKKNIDNHMDSKSKENELKINTCLQKIVGLMKNCELEIQKRNQQVDILLEAYDKYKAHSEALYSILESIKTVRNELSQFETVDN